MASAAIKKIIIIPIFAAVVASQYAYDRSKLEALQIQFPAPLQLIRVFDLGLHSAAASLLWIETIVQLPFFQRGTEPFFNNFRTINDLDPKFSFPYAFTVLVLPTSRAYPDKIAAAIEIGKRGIAEADPDWRIPFYLAAVHLLELKDHENAVKYFDIASQTVGAPHYIKRFSSTFVLAKTFREQTREFWRAVYENAEDEQIKDRAGAYLERLEIFDLLDKASGAYFERFGSYPKTPQDLVGAGIISEVPQDPFGFELVFNDAGDLSVQ